MIEEFFLRNPNYSDKYIKFIYRCESIDSPKHYKTSQAKQKWTQRQQTQQTS